MAEDEPRKVTVPRGPGFRLTSEIGGIDGRIYGWHFLSDEGDILAGCAISERRTRSSETSND